MSGMAQATGIQALARAAELLDQPRLPEDGAAGARRVRDAAADRGAGRGAGRRASTTSSTRSRRGCGSSTPSCSRSSASTTTPRPPATSARASCTRTPSRRRARSSRCPTWATGRATTTPATSRRADYHELLREFLQSMCSRRLGEPYCTYARRYRGYQTDPPVLELNVPELTAEGRAHGDPLQRLEALGRGGHDHEGREGGAQPDRHLPARGRIVPLAPALARALHRAAGREGAAHRAAASRTAEPPRSRSSPTPKRRMGGADGASHHPLHGQGRGREDERGRGHRQALRRGRAAHRRALDRSRAQPVRLARDPARGASPRRWATTCSARRCRPRRRWSATGRACRSGSATCWRSAAWTASRPRS